MRFSKQILRYGPLFSPGPRSETVSILSKVVNTEFYRPPYHGRLGLGLGQCSLNRGYLSWLRNSVLSSHVHHSAKDLPNMISSVWPSESITGASLPPRIGSRTIGARRTTNFTTNHIRSHLREGLPLQ